MCLYYGCAVWVCCMWRLGSTTDVMVPKELQKRQTPMSPAKNLSPQYPNSYSNPASKHSPQSIIPTTPPHLSPNLRSFVPSRSNSLSSPPHTRHKRGNTKSGMGSKKKCESCSISIELWCGACVCLGHVCGQMS